MYFIPLPTLIPNDLLVCSGDVDADVKARLRAAIGTMQPDTINTGDFLTWQSLNASEGSFDLINVLGFTVSQFVGGDNYELLQPYLDDPAKTPADYDFADFLEGQLEYVGYFDIPNQQFGGDSLYLIPGLHDGSVIMFYRTDLFEQAGLAPPTNWDEYLAAAQALNSGDVAGTSMIAKSGDVIT